MNKLIKRIFPPCTYFSTLILHYKIRSRKKWEETQTEKNQVSEYMCDQKYNNNKKEGRRNRERERKRERGRERIWAGTDVPHRAPPASQNIERRRRGSVAAVRRPLAPQRLNTAIISEGDGRLEWHTNFSKTSRERSAPLPSWQTSPN